MKRYTNRLDDGQAIMNCQDCDTDWTNNHAPKCTVMYCRNRLKDRVAAYEDTGLEPQEIEKIRKDVETGVLKQAARRYGVDIEKIRELVEADRDGRCVVFQPGQKEEYEQAAVSTISEEEAAEITGYKCPICENHEMCVLPYMKPLCGETYTHFKPKRQEDALKGETHETD